MTCIEIFGPVRNHMGRIGASGLRQGCTALELAERLPLYYLGSILTEFFKQTEMPL